MSLDHSHNYGIYTGDSKHGEGQFEWYIIADYDDGITTPDSWRYGAQRFRASRASGRGNGFSRMEDARQAMHTQAVEDIARLEAYLEKRLTAVRNAKYMLGTDPANLERFHRDRDWSPAKANGRTSY